MKIKAFITHKIKEDYADCQDRFSINDATKSIAISDGMGSTWQQKIWAQLLVEEFVASNDWTPDFETIKPLCLKWRENVSTFIQNLKETNAPEYLINMNERNLVMGRSAGATFVGIRFKGKEWNGSVLGDSCLIEWNGKEIKFHTSQDVAAFDSFPDYFDSDATKKGRGTPKNIAGELSNGKYLLLVSDPFSDFLLEHQKQGNVIEYMQKLLSVSSHTGFESLVNEWRATGMHNDDTTLVIVEDNGDDDFIIVKADDINAVIENEKRDQEKNAIEQITIKETSVNKEIETYTNNNIDADVILNDIKCELREIPKDSKKYVMGWWNEIENRIRTVLKKYVISIKK